MSDGKIFGQTPENKIESYFLRIAAERFSADLRNFEKDIYHFSDEQLFSIVSYCDNIKFNMEKVRNELAKRLGLEKEDGNSDSDSNSNPNQ